MKVSKKRVRVRVVTAKVGRSRMAILLMGPAKRLPKRDEGLAEAFKDFKGGVYVGYRILPKRSKRKSSA